MRDDYICRGRSFSTQQNAREALEHERASRRNGTLVQQPFVYVCIEGHWHYRAEWRPQVPRKTTTRRLDLPDGRTLMTRRMLAYLSGRKDETVRLHCTPVACDAVNRTPLYDSDAALDTLASLRRVAR